MSDKLNETFKKHLKLLHNKLNLNENENKYYDAKILDNGDYQILAVNNKDNPLNVKVGDVVKKGVADLKQYLSDGDYFKIVDDEKLNEDISEATTDGGSLPELALKGAKVINVMTSSDGKVHLRIAAVNSTQLYDAVLV